MPHPEVAGDPVNYHLFKAEAVIPQLLKVFVDCLLDDCLALIALQIFDFDYHHQVIRIAVDDCYVWHYSLPELLDGFLTVYLEIFLNEVKASLLPQ
jgi:hypothetical protein